MKQLTTRDELDAAFGEDTAILFKHNTTCPISANALREMESFESGGGGPAVYRVDIPECRELSNHVAERTGVEHQSPQVIVLRGGESAYDVALWEITADGLREQVGGQGAA